MRLQDVSLFFFSLLRKTIKLFTEDLAILLTHLQKKSFFVLFYFKASTGDSLILY